MSTVDGRLLEIALEHCSAEHFEQFAQVLLGTVFDVDFVPTGGIHDGGLDGFLENGFAPRDKPDNFYQISKQQDVRRKVRETVLRLRESGRTPRTVTVVTSRTVATIDAKEEALTTELDVTVRIRDRKWIISNSLSRTNARRPQAGEQLNDQHLGSVQ